MTETLSLGRLAGRVADGAMLALPPDYSFVPMAAVRALVRRGVRGLHLVTVPQAGIAADLLIGAGCVATVETAAVSLGELGNASTLQRGGRGRRRGDPRLHLPRDPRRAPGGREGRALHAVAGAHRL